MKFRPLLLIGLSVSCLTPSPRLFAEADAVAPNDVSAATSVPVQHWNWAVPQPHGNSLMDVKFTHNRFLAVGSQGTIQTSPDGITWTQRTSGTRTRLTSIAEGPNTLAVLGVDGTVLVSADGGDTWDVRSIGVSGPSSIAGITYGNGVYVAVLGNITKAYVSTDLQTWSPVVSGSNTLTLYGPVFGNGKFLIPSSNGTLWRSTNGFQWESSATPMVQGFSVAYGSGHYVAMTFGGAYTSDDGVTWTQQWNGQVNGRPVSPHGIGYVGGRFITMGSSMLASPDGISWTVQNTSTSTYGFQSFAYGANTYVAVGLNGLVCTSANLLTWKQRTARPTTYFTDVAAGPAGFVAVGGTTYSYSSDGVTWMDINSGAKSQSNRVVYSNRRYLTLSLGMLGMSTDGKIWKQTPMPAGLGIGTFNSVAWGNNRYVAVAGLPTPSFQTDHPEMFPANNVGKVYWSEDGSNWNLALTPPVGNLLDILFDGTQFVAVGEKNTVLTSPDGSSWTVRSTGSKGTLRRIAFDGTTYVAASFNPDFVYYSSDLQNWTKATLPADTRGSYDFRDLIYAGGRFAAMSGHGTLFFSTDGINWDVSDCDTDNFTVGIAYNGSRYVVASNPGCIVYSDTVTSNQSN